jgi:sulfhydrogenase subunit beta (sulfur reductase)
MHILESHDLSALLDGLRRRNYTVVGPTIRDKAIVLDHIESVGDLPRGWTDEQEPAHYSLNKRSDNSYFGYVVGPQAWKRFLYPPRLRLFTARKAGKAFEIETPEKNGTPRYAFLGVRPCELHAIQLQDKVFNSADYADRNYSAIRREAVIICVNCVEPGGNCFCVSMKTGPKANAGFDLALTEIVDNNVHHFVVETGSVRGESLLADVPHRAPEESEIRKMERVLDAAAHAVVRTMDTDELPKLLNENFEHPHWDDVGKRCMACGNCTMVCPTCFCSTVEDVTDLTGDSAERWRRWDSCFTNDFTKIAGGNIRLSTRTRYRQWMMHKLAHWVDQFGESGCVGCGRCITWCPVGIDITSEAREIRQKSAAPVPS